MVAHAVVVVAVSTGGLVPLRRLIETSNFCRILARFEPRQNRVSRVGAAFPILSWNPYNRPKPAKWRARQGNVATMASGNVARDG